MKLTATIKPGPTSEPEVEAVVVSYGDDRRLAGVLFLPHTEAVNAAEALMGGMIQDRATQIIALRRAADALDDAVDMLDPRVAPRVIDTLHATAAECRRAADISETHIGGPRPRACGGRCSWRSRGATRVRSDHMTSEEFDAHVERLGGHHAAASAMTLFVNELEDRRVGAVELTEEMARRLREAGPR